MTSRNTRVVYDHQLQKTICSSFHRAAISEMRELIKTWGNIDLRASCLSINHFGIFNDQPPTPHSFLIIAVRR